MKDVKEAILSLGSNLGDKLKNLKLVTDAINKIPETKITDVSKIYLTKPFKTPDIQSDFLNCCVKIQTKLSSQTILGCCLGIEAAMGRIRKFKFCSRNIDIDLLLFEEEIQNNKDLILPHPKIKERAFVLKPLNDICKNNKFKSFNFNDQMQILDFSEVSLFCLDFFD